MKIDLSTSETERFKIPIYRAKSDYLSLDSITEFVNVTHPDSLLILRFPATEQYKLHSLNHQHINYIVADTLVYYTKSLTQSLSSTLKNPLKFIEADTTHLSLLTSMVNEIFNNYTNHYFSNPILPKEQILEGYQEWVKNYITNNEVFDKVAFLVYLGENLVGFATCRQHNENLAEGVLYGVRPSFAGLGIYTDIIKFTQQYYQNKQVKKMTISTQIQNYAVQKIWIKEGFVLEEALLTLHIFGKHLNF